MAPINTPQLSAAALISPLVTCAHTRAHTHTYTHTHAHTQALVVVSGYKHSMQVDWVDPLFKRVVVAGDFKYLSDYKKVFPLTASLFEALVKRCVGVLPSCVTSLS